MGPIMTWISPDVDAVACKVRFWDLEMELVDETMKSDVAVVVWFRQRGLENRDWLLRKEEVKGREKREKEESLGKLEDKDENFGFRIDFIVEMVWSLSCRKGGRGVYVEGFCNYPQ